MNENENRGFFDDDSDWDDIDLSDLTETAESEADAEAAGTDQTPEAEAAEPAEEQAGEETAAGADQSPEAGADQSFTLKHLDETRTVGRDEVIALAQKGMDYDRIRARLDAQSDYEAIKSQLAAQQEAFDFLNELAKKNNMSVEDFIDAATATTRAKPDRSDYDAQLRQVKLERRERALDRREAKAGQAEQQAEAQSQQAARVQADVQRFKAAFPDVKPEDIPQDVWAEVEQGKSLTEVWSMREAARLRAELEAARKTNDNAQRSAGSRQTAGAADAQDDFDRLWYDGD